MSPPPWWIDECITAIEGHLDYLDKEMPRLGWYMMFTLTAVAIPVITLFTWPIVTVHKLLTVKRRRAEAVLEAMREMDGVGIV